MHTFLHSLILIVILALSSPYDQLPSLLPVEARKLNSNGGTFTVDLIHRDSLLSPQEHQKRLPFGLVSRGHQNTHLPAAYSEKNDLETEIIPSGGDYLMKIAIGTPPFEFMAVADTGSDLIWLQCSTCEITQTCIPHKSPLFDPTKSSTYKPISCNSPSCSNSDLLTLCYSSNTNNSKDECAYVVIYLDGLNSIGVLSTDTITFPSADVSVTLPSSVFGCGYAQNGSLSNGEGIIGLGVGPSSLVSQLGPKINHKFSYCLVPLTSGATSKLKFGSDATCPGVVSTPFTIKKGSDHYFLTLEGISIGERSVQVGQDVIIDSGTTLTYLDTNVYNGVKDALKSFIGLSPIADLKGPELCYEAQESSLNPPDVVFHFKGADVVLKSGNIFKQITQDIACLAMLPTNGTNFIFGNVAQVNFEVGYDLQAKQVSFAPTDCSKY